MRSQVISALMHAWKHSKGEWFSCFDLFIDAQYLSERAMDNTKALLRIDKDQTQVYYYEGRLGLGRIDDLAWSMENDAEWFIINIGVIDVEALRCSLTQVKQFYDDWKKHLGDAQ